MRNPKVCEDVVFLQSDLPPLQKIMKKYETAKPYVLFWGVLRNIMLSVEVHPEHYHRHFVRW
jgi:hypothetical protein